MAARRALIAALALVIASLLMVYALRDVDVREIGRVLADVRYHQAPLFLLALTALFALKAERWARILSAVAPLRARDVAPAMIIGFAGNNVLPARLGEVARSVVLSRERAIPLAGVVSSIALERLLDLCAILILYLGVVSWMGDEGAGPRLTVWPVGVACFSLLALAWALHDLPQRVVACWRPLARRLPSALGGALERVLRDAIRALATVRSAAVLGTMLLSSLAQWGLATALVWLSLAAIGETVSPIAATVALAASVFAAMLPSAPGYVGAMQAAFVLALVPFGVRPEAALAASVVYSAGQWIPVTALGAWLLLRPAAGSHRRRWLLLAGTRGR